MPDQELHSERFRTDRGKTFFFDLKKNENGKFLKITESIPTGEGFRRNFITVPEESMEEFTGLMKKSIDYLKTTF